jgi:hypothetical protein
MIPDSSDTRQYKTVGLSGGIFLLTAPHPENNLAFRVLSVPEPSTSALLAIGTNRLVHRPPVVKLAYSLGLCSNRIERSMAPIQSKRDCAPRSPKTATFRWGETELLMLGRWPDAELAKLTHRTLAEVVAKRKSLGISQPA